MEYQTSQPEITQSTTTWGAWLRDSYNPLKESNFAITNLLFASIISLFPIPSDIKALYFIYLFIMAALSLICRLLIVVASFVAERKL